VLEIVPGTLRRPIARTSRGTPNVSEQTAERIAYGVAIVILVVGGALLRTPILNWISGPAIVIACVALIPPLLTRDRAKDVRR
jgi:hypothetical protein